MKKYILAALFATGSVFGTTGGWNVDPAHSAARFSVRHLMISTVKGEIGGMAGTFTFDPKNVATLKIDVSLDPKTITTHNADRDQHLRAPDFFHVEKHPKMTFVSKKITKKKGKAFDITGDITIRGVTKSITFHSDGFTDEIKDSQGKRKRGFTATAELNRQDFGVSWNNVMEAGGVVVGDKIKIEVEAELFAKGTKA